MCGIVGFLQSTGESEDTLHALVSRMADTLHHRGPDDEGCWIDAEAGIALGHQRLAIIDLSREAHQPIVSACGRYVLVYNGEVYNHLELRGKLEQLGHHFRGRSDTEVILQAISSWGLRAALQLFVGMFAFALWDKEERCLFLTRDQIGIKPLYYGQHGATFMFSSELKALRAHPEFRPTVNRNALALFLAHGYIPGTFSIYQDIQKLLPGQYAVIRIGQEPQLHTYWDAYRAAVQGLRNPLTCSEDEAIQELEERLLDAVRLQMVADVPLGAFLSGGIDSSTVVALMQAQTNRPVKTFSIGFHESDYNEATEAKQVAKHLGTDHTEFYITPREAQEAIFHLPELYDEPFADHSQIPTFLLSQLAHREVKVSLSGDGGDELFQGYRHYIDVFRIWKLFKFLPMDVRKNLAGFVETLAPEIWDELLSLFPNSLSIERFGDRLYKLAHISKFYAPDDLYVGYISDWDKAERIVIGATAVESPIQKHWGNSRSLGFLERMSLTDIVTCLPEKFLAKVDRASMGVSLEVRVPILDHRLMEWTWRIPQSMKIRNGQGKWLLRQVLHKYVPKELIERPKHGFNVPIDDWLRGPLRGWAEDMIDGRKLYREGFFKPTPIKKMWNEHLTGHRYWQRPIWRVLMFQLWRERWL